MALLAGVRYLCLRTFGQKWRKDNIIPRPTMCDAVSETVSTQITITQDVLLLLFFSAKKSTEI